MFNQLKVSTFLKEKSASRSFGFMLATMCLVLFGYAGNASAETATFVDLGTAGNFAVLSKVQITSTGATTIVGNIGVSPAAHTFLAGFSLKGDETTDTFLTSDQLLGYKAYAANLQSPTPSDMTTAIGDMALAYSAAIDVTANPAGTGDFLDIGAGTVSTQTLTPGVYTWDTNVNITGNLTLNCSSTPSAVFVFQIAGNLDLASGKQILLTNCSASNIFWAVSGTTFLNSTSHFEGTLLAGPNTSEITVITGATVTGRLLGEKTIALQNGTTITDPTADAPAIGPVFIDTNTNGSLNAGELYFTTIQDAVDTAVSGDTIVVGAETYTENVVVNKTLTLNGAQVGDDARTRSGAESIVNGAGGAFKLEADNIVLDGFTIQDASDRPGIETKPDFSGYQIKNNIIKNNTFGIYLHSQGTTQTVVSQNLFDSNNIDGASAGNGIYSDQGATNILIDSNKFTGDLGTSVNFSYVSEPPTVNANITISNNEITEEGTIFALKVSTLAITGNTISNPLNHGIQLEGNNNVTITGNSITNVSDEENFGWSAIRLSTAQGVGSNSDVTITDNTLTGSAFGYGINISDTAMSDSPEVHNNAIVGHDIGITNGDLDTIVNATTNWWGNKNGPNDPTSGDGSIPETNAGTGSEVVGAVNYSDWCVNDTCTTPSRSHTGSRARRATPAIPAVPHVSPAIPAIPSANSHTVGGVIFTFVRDLALGMEGTDVTELQNRLTREGVYTGPITGYFGPLTEGAVKAYQSKMGINNTGYVGPLTKEALNRGEGNNTAVQAQIAAIKLQIIDLIRQLIAILQAELDAK